MDTTQAQQKALDDALVALANYLKIRKCNLWLISTTLQVVLDALKLTPFYKAFEISANVLEIYLQEFWVTNSIHHTSLHFKINGKSHTVNVDNFRDMLQICPKLPGQKFKDPLFEKEILSFIRDLGHTREIKNVDYVYLLWEDLVYQLENKNYKKKNDMCYPQFTKVIIDYIIKKDLSIPMKNTMFWHTAKDDPMFTTIRVISKHQTTQIYSAILPKQLTNQAMIESESYKTYYAYVTGEKTPKPKYVQKKADSETSPKKKPVQAPKGKRLKATAKKSSDDEDDDADNQGDDDQDDDHVDDKDDDGQDDDNKQTELDNDGDDFIHPKLSTFDEEERHDEKLNEEEEGLDLRVQTPSYFESTDDEAYDEVTQIGNVEKEKLDKEKTNKEEEVNELYDDMNINLEGSDTEMIDALLTRVLLYHQASSLTCSTLIWIQKSIKEQVNVQVKEQVSKILPRIEKLVNEQLEAEVLTRSSNEAKTSHAVASNLSELKLKKILIDKYRTLTCLKDFEMMRMMMKNPPLDQTGGPSEKRAGKEPESSSAPKEKTSESTGKSKEWSKSHQKSTGKSAQADELIHTAEDLEEPEP
nr:hypothetical protein [Tanacetum cinerariifolium]